MIIVKLTILVTLIVKFLVYMFKSWALRHPLKLALEDYPWWSYIMAILVILDVVGVFASVIWLLFFFF